MAKRLRLPEAAFDFAAAAPASSATDYLHGSRALHRPPDEAT